METAMIIALGADRSVSARELCRRGAAVLDEVEFERRALLVARAGRPVAFLTPVAGDKGPRPNADSPTAEELDEIAGKLKPHYRKVLEAVARRAPEPWSRDGEDIGEPPDRVGSGVGALLVYGLATQTMRGIELLPKGARLAAHLGYGKDV